MCMHMHVPSVKIYAAAALSLSSAEAAAAAAAPEIVTVVSVRVVVMDYPIVVAPATRTIRPCNDSPFFRISLYRHTNRQIICVNE